MQTSFACGLRRQKLNRKKAMAIYHLSVKPISRSDGRSVTAAAAYRAAAKISDERTGQLHDYTRKQGVVSVTIITPKLAPKWSQDRSQIWNAAELAEIRKNATVAREFEIALPSELNATQRQQLAHEFAQELVTQHGCIADVAIHQPGKEGDQRNHHAHILLSTRRLGPDGFTEKTRELDDYNSGPKWVKKWRERYAQLQNQYLQQSGSEQRVDHRSYKDQGLDLIPTCHLGPSATAYERRTGLSSKKRQNWEEYANQRLLAAKEQGELERQAQEVESTIIALDTDLKAALAERDGQRVYPSAETINAGKASFLSAYQQFQQDQQAKQEAQERKLQQEQTEQRAKQLEAEQARQAQLEKEQQKAEQVRLEWLLEQAKANKQAQEAKEKERLEQEALRLVQETAQKQEQARLDEMKRLQDIEATKRRQQLQAQAAQRQKEQRARQLQQWLEEADAILNLGLETLETELAVTQQAEAKEKAEAEAAALAAQAAESEQIKLAEVALENSLADSEDGHRNETEHTQQPMAEDKIEPEPEPPVQDDGPSYSPW